MDNFKSEESNCDSDTIADGQVKWQNLNLAPNTQNDSISIVTHRSLLKDTSTSRIYMKDDRSKITDNNWDEINLSK